MAHAEATTETVREGLDSQTVALRMIVGMLAVGAAWMFAGLLVPFFLAVVLAVAFSPVADRLERLGLPRAMASLACMLTVLLVLAAASGLILYEAGNVLGHSDRYLDRFSQLLAQATQWTGSDRAFASFSHDEAPDGLPSATPAETHGMTTPRGSAMTPAAWKRSILRGFSHLDRWAGTGVGGLLGLVGGVVVVLSFLFYLLESRTEWVDRIGLASARLGLEPGRKKFGKVRDDMVTYARCLSMIAAGYVVVVSLALWAIGVPQPLLWGVLAGLLEVVPYFGPLIASVLPTLVALSLGHWWQPAAVLGLFLTLHLTEGYILTPMLYGKAIRLDPVMILFGAIFFGYLWGPFGLALATPMLILLRGLLSISPDTPALDALADLDGPKAAA